MRNRGHLMELQKQMYCERGEGETNRQKQRKRRGCHLWHTIVYGKLVWLNCTFAHYLDSLYARKLHSLLIVKPAYC